MWLLYLGRHAPINHEHRSGAYTLSRFKPPNENSREALNSQQVKIGSHQLNIKPELKDKALKCLDEVQSYILVERSLENKDVALDSILHEYFYAVIIHYYVERQCLLKCTRSILTHALSLESVSGDGNAIKKEALKLITDGLEAKLINVLQLLFSSSHPEQMDLDLFTLWAEETLIEDNLVLDILFLAYYESFCTCNGERWKTLCLLYKGTLSGSYNFENLAVSTEALRSSYQTKVQLLLILIETLDLESLLQMVHDAIPFSGAPYVEVFCLVFSPLGIRLEGPADGYHSVLRTFISAFIASYEINLQLEDKSLKLILDILCKIYQGEESLCIQFWDRESFIDGPIRYNFLDKSVGISSLVEINNGSVGEDMSQIVETHLPLHVPGFEGLAVCFALMDIGSSSHFQSTDMGGQIESNMRSPSRVSEVALKANIFGFSNGHNDPSRGTWFLSGKLAKMLLIDCEQNDSCCSLTISGYCLILPSIVLSFGLFVQPPKRWRLYFSRLVDLTEIEGLQMAICAVLDILFIMLSKFSKVFGHKLDISSSPPFFHQAVFSSATKPFPVVAALVSLISYFRNPNTWIHRKLVVAFSGLLLRQLGVIGVMLIFFTFKLECPTGYYILLEQSELNEDLFVATVNLLTSAALHQPAFLVAVLPTKVNKDVQLSNGGGVKLPTNDFESGKASVVHAVLHHIERSNNLINSNPRILLNVLNFLRASENFWKKLSCPISIISSMQAPPPENAETEVEDLSVRYQCQSAILEIIAHDMFLHKKLLHAESFVKQLPESQQNTVRSEKSKAADLEDILSAWCGSSVLGNLTKSLTYCAYDPELYLRAKVAASVITARVMVNLSIGDAGSLSLRSHPAFSELLAQYSQHGYSAGKEPNYLILSDLYYHLQGQLEGREISPGPFKELSQDTYLFDLKCVRADLGLDLWDYSKWKESKATAETMLHHMKAANSMAMLTSSKLSALRPLRSVLTVYGEDSLETKSTVRQIPDQLVFSCIDHICLSFHNTVESLAPVPSASEDIFHFLAAQAESLLYFMMYAHKSLPLSVCILVLKTSAFISRGTQWLGEPSSLSAPLLCPSVLKEEFDGWKKPSFMNSKSGWFALSALSCVSKPKFSTIPTTSTALVIKTQATVNGSHISQSYFSDSIALQIYRITFLLLKFLSLQAEGAARREEEVGFVDLDHFPELPMPEILLGLQDQAITIVRELCEANRSNEIQIEVQSICCLLLQIMEMALHLELCVLQIYGIRPVLGRVEDFSKEVKLLIKATERRAFLKPSVKSLKQMVSVIYPGLLQADEFL
ncbi:nucleoporin NUP188-like protein [Pyrus ussuriensis x Pyrus communis]|uniref:Nucleoporin NUP188-like protein n=1 Tax=Pyrus ussuriensis x Pyrus communis TaxID=2448454 RepID=A0A5N5FHN0_9ROSA|nr:nucleoporin NUP188-like protein [Pyrus ussuriensis x Pyrus communis]